MQIFKKIISTILVLTMVFSLTACSGIKNKKFGVSFDLKQEPKNLDPQASADNASLIIINNTMEGLLALDNNGKIQKATASSYEMSPDKLTYTFTINKDAKWANGEKVTAKDFLFTFQRLLLKTTNSPYSKLFFCIKNAKLAFDNPEKMSQLGVTAPSNDKLIINLSSPSDNFLKLLTMPCAVACNQKYFESTRGKYGLEANTTISNGAFTVDSWQHKKSIRLTKNDEYYAKKDVKVSFVSLFIDTTIRKINQSQPTSSSTSSKPNKNEEPLQDNTADRLTDGDTLSAMIDGFNDNQLDEKNFKK
ncbi:MAG: ABC transporter substrate-binding protein [Oscillospiraceae bacterium]